MKMASTAAKVCAVFGYGKGIGAAVARKWSSEGYKVAVMARSTEKLSAAEREIPNAKGFACDVTQPEAIDRTIEAIESSLGPVDVLVWNAGNGVWKTWDKIDLELFDAAMKTNVYGLLRATQKVGPGMIERAAAAGGGKTSQSAILVTGATASMRGKPFTVGFAPQKGAQRLLSQSLARDLGPKGVHVGLFIIDGVVGAAGAEEDPTKLDPDAIGLFIIDGVVGAAGGAEEDPTKLDPDAIADTYWTVANQPRTCWSFETEIRPAVENW